MYRGVVFLCGRLWPNHLRLCKGGLCKGVLCKDVVCELCNG